MLLSISASAADFWSPRTSALGGAGHAGPLLNDAIYLNPSFASLLPTYSFGLNYLWYGGGNFGSDGAPDFHGHDLNVSLQDGRSEIFQAGVGLTMTDSLKEVQIGASKAVVKRLGFGLGGKFIFPNDASHSIVRDATLSVSGVPFGWLQLSLVVDNLFESAAGESLDLYREFLVGTKLNVMGIVLVYLDPHYTPDLPGTPWGHEVGLEFAVMPTFFLRMGNFNNAHIPIEEAHGSGYSAGFGWIAGASSLDFAVFRPLNPISATAYDLGMTVYF